SSHENTKPRNHERLSFKHFSWFRGFVMFGQIVTKGQRMTRGWQGTLLGVTATVFVFTLGAVLLRGQASTSDQKPLMAEEVFKNIQVLKGTTVNELMGTMGVFSAALGISCEDCH